MAEAHALRQLVICDVVSLWKLFGDGRRAEGADKGMEMGIIRWRLDLGRESTSSTLPCNWIFFLFQIIFARRQHTYMLSRVHFPRTECLLSEWRKIACQNCLICSGNNLYCQPKQSTSLIFRNWRQRIQSRCRRHRRRFETIHIYAQHLTDFTRNWKTCICILRNCFDVESNVWTAYFPGSAVD